MAMARAQPEKSKHVTRESRFLASQAFQVADPVACRAAAPRIASFLQAEDHDADLRVEWIRTLRYLNHTSETVIKAMINSLHDDDVKVVRETIQALTSFGSRASPAISTLEKLRIESPSLRIRKDASDALMVIDQ